MNDGDRMAAWHDGRVCGETPALRDAIAGLTGNLGIAVYAWQLDARRAVQYIEFRAAAAVREREVAVMSAHGEGRL